MEGTQRRSNDLFVAADLGLDAGALCVSGRLLPGRPASAVDHLDVAVSGRRLFAGDSIPGRWDDDLDIRAQSCANRLLHRQPVIGAVSNEPRHRRFDLLEETRQRVRVTNMLGGEV